MKIVTHTELGLQPDAEETLRRVYSRGTISVIEIAGLFDPAAYDSEETLQTSVENLVARLKIDGIRIVPEIRKTDHSTPNDKRNGHIRGEEDEDIPILGMSGRTIDGSDFLETLYFRSVASSTSSPLTREKEVALFQKMRQGDSDARTTIILANLRFVCKEAKKYCGRGLPYLDLVQEGTLGLMKALEGFDENRGYRLLTYAGWWIRHSIQAAILKQGFDQIKIPGWRPERKHPIPQWSFVSLDAEIGDTDGEGTEYSEVVADTAAHTAHEETHIHLLVERLRVLMTALPPKFRHVLELRYGLHDNIPRTLEEVGDRLGVSRERVRQIEFKALRMLRKRIDPHEVSELRQQGPTNGKKSKGAPQTFAEMVHLIFSVPQK